MKYICYLLIVIKISFSSETLSENGEEWKTWSFKRKIGYVDGFIDGFNMYNNLLDKTVNLEKDRNPYWHHPLILDLINTNSNEYISYLKNISNIEFVDRIDGFYIEPDNNELKIQDAIQIINLRAEGKSEKADKLLINKQKKYLKGK